MPHQHPVTFRDTNPAPIPVAAILLPRAFGEPSDGTSMGVLQSLSFCDGLVSLSGASSRSAHVAAGVWVPPTPAGAEHVVFTVRPRAAPGGPVTQQWWGTLLSVWADGHLFGTLLSNLSSTAAQWDFRILW